MGLKWIVQHQAPDGHWSLDGFQQHGRCNCNGFGQNNDVAATAFGLLPLGRVAWDALHGQLGANPIAEVLNRFGFWTLFFLCASLVPTPLKLLFGLKWPLALRRMVGLFAFTYALRLMSDDADEVARLSNAGPPWI